MWRSMLLRVRARWSRPTVPEEPVPWQAPFFATAYTESGELRRLPIGLGSCGKCGAIRGTCAETGAVSACYCSGARCNWCGVVRRRPISDYYSVEDGHWWHVPYVSLMSHICERPADARPATRWETLHGDPEVDEARRELTERTIAEYAARQRQAVAERPRAAGRKRQASTFEDHGATLTFSGVRPPAPRKKASKRASARCSKQGLPPLDGDGR